MAVIRLFSINIDLNITDGAVEGFSYYTRDSQMKPLITFNRGAKVTCGGKSIICMKSRVIGILKVYAKIWPVGVVVAPPNRQSGAVGPVGPGNTSIVCEAVGDFSHDTLSIALRENVTSSNLIHISIVKSPSKIICGLTTATPCM